MSKRGNKDNSKVADLRMCRSAPVLQPVLIRHLRDLSCTWMSAVKICKNKVRHGGRNTPYRPLLIWDVLEL